MRKPYTKQENSRNLPDIGWPEAKKPTLIDKTNKSKGNKSKAKKKIKSKIHQSDTGFCVKRKGNTNTDKQAVPFGVEFSKENPLLPPLSLSPSPLASGCLCSFGELRQKQSPTSPTASTRRHAFRTRTTNTDNVGGQFGCQRSRRDSRRQQESIEDNALARTFLGKCFSFSVRGFLALGDCTMNDRFWLETSFYHWNYWESCLNQIFLEKKS